jgi:hypothetical protein
MAPSWDSTVYDLCARNLLQGGVHYRDTFDTNLPGVVWIHVAARGLLGWRSEILQIVDLIFFTGIVFLFLQFLGPECTRLNVRIWAAVALFSYYLSLPDNCHCQRDTWMMLFALAALFLRWRQVQRLRNNPIPKGVLGWALLEGICWGAGFWIKPFVAVPALIAWLTGLLLVRGSKPGFTYSLALDTPGLLAGGLLAGAAGVTWLLASGTWPYFYEVMFDWNQEYYQSSRTLPRLVPLLVALVQFRPWSLVHLVAVPVALIMVWRGLAKRHSVLNPLSNLDARVLLATFYLAWLAQGMCLQMAHQYVFATTILPALAVLAAWGGLPGRSITGRLIVVVFIAFVAINYPVLRPERLSCWTRCLREGSTSELRDILSLEPPTLAQIAKVERERGPIYLRGQLGQVDWVDLGRVATFLRGQGVSDKDLLCFHDSPHALYLEMNLEPPTRFFHFNLVLRVFPQRREAIRHELNAGTQKYIVSDLRAIKKMTHRPLSLSYKPLGLPPDFPPSLVHLFPWYEPVVFHAGRYLVHRMTQPIRKSSLDFPEEPTGVIGDTFFYPSH